jgi:hypothetical protein
VAGKPGRDPLPAFGSASAMDEVEYQSYPRIGDISDLMGHSGTSVTESVYRHEIRPALTTGATAMNKILSKKRARSA